MPEYQCGQSIGILLTLPDAYGICIVAVGKLGAPFDVGANTLRVNSRRVFFPASDPTAIRNAVLETNRAYISGLPPPTTEYSLPTEMFLGYARGVPYGALNTFETDLSIGSLVRLDARALALPKPLLFVVLAFLVNINTDNGPSVLLLQTNEKDEVRSTPKVR